MLYTEFVIQKCFNGRLKDVEKSLKLNVLIEVINFKLVHVVIFYISSG